MMFYYDGISKNTRLIAKYSVFDENIGKWVFDEENATEEAKEAYRIDKEMHDKYELRFDEF